MQYVLLTATAYQRQVCCVASASDDRQAALVGQNVLYHHQTFTAKAYTIKVDKKKTDRECNKAKNI